MIDISKLRLSQAMNRTKLTKYMDKVAASLSVVPVGLIRRLPRPSLSADTVYTVNQGQSAAEVDSSARWGGIVGLMYDAKEETNKKRYQRID